MSRKLRKLGSRKLGSDPSKVGEGEFIIPALVLGLCNQIPEEQKNQKFVYRVNKDSEYFPEDISNVFLDRRYLGNEIVDNHYGEKEGTYYVPIHHPSYIYVYKRKRMDEYIEGIERIINQLL